MNRRGLRNRCHLWTKTRTPKYLRLEEHACARALRGAPRVKPHSPLLVNQVDADRVRRELYEARQGQVGIDISAQVTCAQSEAIIHQAAHEPDEHEDQRVPQEDPVTEEVQEASGLPVAPAGRPCQREGALDLAVPLGNEAQSRFGLTQSTKDRRKTTVPCRLTRTARVLQERMKYPSRAYWAMPTAKKRPPIDPARAQ